VRNAVNIYEIYFSPGLISPGFVTGWVPVVGLYATGVAGMKHFALLIFPGLLKKTSRFFDVDCNL